jgi:hypothetical protein
VAAVMAVMMSMGTALASHGGGGGGGGGGGKQNNKVYVCHNGNTLLVTKKQRNYFVNHYRYDYAGVCDIYYR